MAQTCKYALELMATSVNIAGIGYPSISKVFYEMLLYTYFSLDFFWNKQKAKAASLIF